MIKATPISVKTPLFVVDPEGNPNQCLPPTPYTPKRKAKELFLMTNRG